MALSGVTDAYGKGTDHADRMRGTAKIISSMLRTWSGTSEISPPPCYLHVILQIIHRSHVFLYT